MIVWLDNHLSPAVAAWIAKTYGFTCVQIRDLGLARADDWKIFSKAKAAEAVLITKDRDFAELVERLGPPPAIIWLTFGNTSTPRLIEILASALPQALHAIQEGAPLVEVHG